MTTRRHFMSQTAAAASAMSFPLIAGAQAKSVKVGVLHPVTGALAYSGQQCRMGALIGHAHVDHVGQVVFGCRLGGGQTNGRSKGPHHRADTGFVHLFNCGRSRLWTRLRVAQHGFNFGATQ